jgi:hypothetical protein
MYSILVEECIVPIGSDPTTMLCIGDSYKAHSFAVMDVSTPKLQEHLRKNMFGSRNNNNSDRANEEVKARKSERFARWEQVSTVCSNHGAIC